MESQVIITLSTTSVAIALTGMLVAHRGPTPKTARVPLAIIFFGLAGLCGLPLASAFSETLSLFYLPALLPLLFLIPVAIYGYAKALAESPSAQGVEGWRDRFFPSAGLAVMLGYWSLSLSEKRTLFLEGELPSGFVPAALTFITFFLVLIWCVTSLAYLVAALRTLQHHRNTLRQFYSNTEAYDLYWFDGHLLGLVGLWAATVLSLLSDNLGPVTFVPTPIIYSLTIVFLLTLLGYSLSVVPSRMPVSQNNSPETVKPTKYARSALSTTQAERIAKKIESAMLESNLYQDPQITLGKLAHHIRTPQNHVSQTLNTHIGMSFFDYIAQRRVEASKLLLAKSDKAIHDIALEVGFNARSTYYKAFKRETGLTPRAYRLALREERNLTR